MKINMIATSKLKNYDRNARTHSNEQIEIIKNSIKAFGFNDPIECDKNMVVISGHARLRAAIELGVIEVPTVIHEHLSERDKRGYILAANKSALSAEWDNNLLSTEIIDLNIQELDLKLTGFSEEELQNILNPEIINYEIIENEVHNTDSETKSIICKKGDLWILGNHKLKCGDSTNSDDVNHVMENIKSNLMITDPPYGVNYEPEWRNKISYGENRVLGKVTNDSLFDWTGTYSLFEGNVAYVWHAAKYAIEVGRHLKNCNFEIISQIIWAKQHFALSRGDYHWKHEACWYVVRKGEKHSWNGKRDQSTLWEINNNSFGLNKEEDYLGHATQKPLECMQRPIENNSKPKEWIYDPFGGSGTTLIACEKTGRQCAMIEIEEKYCDNIIKRWQKCTNKKAILEKTGEFFDGGER